MENYFNENDKQKFIDFLNAVAVHAKFEMDTKQLCEYFKLLAHMQQVILPKIDSNILEVKEVGIHNKEKFEASKKSESKPASKAGGKRK